MIIERLSEDTLFLADIGKKRGVFLLLLQDYLADKKKRRSFFRGKRIKISGLERRR